MTTVSCLCIHQSEIIAEKFTHAVGIQIPNMSAIDNNYGVYFNQDLLHIVSKASNISLQYLA